MWPTRNNEKSNVRSRMMNAKDESHIVKQYTGKRRVRCCRDSALPENSTKLTWRPNMAGQDDNNDESVERELRHRDVQVKLLKRINHTQRSVTANIKIVLKTDKEQLRQKNRTEKQQRQPPVRDQCAPTPSPSFFPNGGQTHGQKTQLTAPDRTTTATAADRQQHRYRRQYPSSSAECASAEDNYDEQRQQL